MAEVLKMELVQLERYELEGFLGSGADYEAQAATDRSTGKRVVLKRPNPDYVTRDLHHGVERLSEELISIHDSMGQSLPHLARLEGYTEIAQHDDYFGDSLNNSYRVLIQERARGIPLVSALRDKFKGHPIGLGQNLFALHPLVPHLGRGHFAVHRQLIEVEEACYKAGHLLLDMRPENIYFEPREGRITIIDIGAIPTRGPTAQGKIGTGNQRLDIHDFLLEVFTFYATADGPPAHVKGYGGPIGMTAVPHFDRQVESLVRSFSGVKHMRLREAAITTLQKIRDRSYGSLDDFQVDFEEYLALLAERNKELPDLPELAGVWGEATKMLSDNYWGKFLFDPLGDLAAYRKVI